MRKYLFFFILLTGANRSTAQISLPVLQPLQYTSRNLGNALNFDGTNTYALGKVYTKDSLVSFTIEFWIKNTGTDDANDRIYGSYLNEALQIGKSTTGLKFKATDLGNSNGWNAPCTLESNRWVHISFTRSSTVLQVYKNAILVGTYSVTAASNLPTFFRLGSNVDGVGENGNFTIDEFRIWKVARTPTQIQQYMYTTIDPVANTNLLLYYRFDQGIVGDNNAAERGLFNSAISN